MSQENSSYSLACTKWRQKWTFQSLYSTPQPDYCSFSPEGEALQNLLSSFISIHMSIFFFFVNGEQSDSKYYLFSTFKSLGPNPVPRKYQPLNKLLLSKTHALCGSILLQFNKLKFYFWSGRVRSFANVSLQRSNEHTDKNCQNQPLKELLKLTRVLH